MDTTGHNTQLARDLQVMMERIRAFEEQAILAAERDRLVLGAIHPSIGQEACAAGVMVHLSHDDILLSTHRGHGHTLAKGADPLAMMRELLGREGGCCGGKGGSMHLGDLTKGIIPAVAIVGGGIPIATGVGLAFKMKKQKNVAVCFMGDGATNEGAFHEAVNMGAIWEIGRASCRERV